MLPHPDIGDAAFDRQLFTYPEKTIALIPACLNCPPGYRRELGYPEYQMLPILILETLLLTDSSSHIWSS